MSLKVYHDDMLVNCPKCGFSQPKDRYCASCGVDMRAYRPLSPSLWKKTLANPFFHVGVIFTLVAVAVVFIRKQQAEELKARVEYLKGGPVIVEKSFESNADRNLGEPSEISETQTLEVATSSETQDALAGGPPSPPPAPSAQTQPLAGTPSTSPSSPGSPSPQAGTPSHDIKAINLKMVASYYEVDRQTVSQWLAEMRRTGLIRQFDSVTMGPVPLISQKLKSAGSLKNLQRVEASLPLNNGTHEWFLGTHKSTDLESEIGLFSALVLNGARSDGATLGEIEIQRAFRDPKDPSRSMERVSFGGPFELTAGSAFIAIGLIPRRYSVAIEEDTNPDPYLRIFKSRAFLNQESEFVFVLELEPMTK